MATITVGIIGMVLVLIAYTLNQLGRLRDDHVVYDALNFIGALLLFVYALAEEVYPFLILNAVWGAVAGHDLYKRYKSKQKPATVKTEAKAEVEEKTAEEPVEEKPAEKEPEPEEPPVEKETDLTERRP